jgi:hypothetical protein
MLRLVAEHAHMWNVFADPDGFAHKAGVLDEWCARVGRDPGAIERTTTLRDKTAARCGEYVAAGVGQLIVASGGPDYDLSLLRDVIAFRDAHNG